MPFKIRNVRIKIMIIMVVLVMYVIATYIVVENYVFTSKDVKSTSTTKFEYVVVHLDLKGAPPKLSYLETILPILKKHGVNGLLIEYEDMFPYEGRLEKLRSPKCYMKEELHAFLTTAVSSGFEIIPLIQTFGHMEFVLKLKELAHLRERPHFPDAICPSSPESLKLIHDMLEQVIYFHRKITPLKHVHVGCDEVYKYKYKYKFFIGNTKLHVNNFKHREALNSHIYSVIDTVHSLSPDSTVLIWDDMYRAVKPINTVDLRFPKTEAVYWDYTPNLTQVSHENMYKYNQMFDNLWIATAFKGADGRSKILPSLETRFFNHLSWLNFFYSYSTLRNLYRIKGIILTGWSRYSHFDPLCELLPASIHSLIFNLILIELYNEGNVVEDMSRVNDYIEQYRSNFTDSLSCLQFDHFPKKFDAESCYYEEADLYCILQNLCVKRSIIKSLITENALKYLSDLPNSTNFTAEYEYVRSMKANVGLCSQILKELQSMDHRVKELLSPYFENYIVEEYIMTNIRNFKTTIKKVIELSKYKHFQFQVPGDNTSYVGLRPPY